MTEIKNFIQSVDWPLVARFFSTLLYVAGAVWLVLLLAATYEIHQQSWLATFPYLAFVPMYLFLSLYGLQCMRAGHNLSAGICTLANFCILAMF